MGSWAQSRSITKQTWGVVKQNPYMLLFPVVAGIVAMVVFIAVAAIGLAVLGAAGTFTEVTEHGTVQTSSQWIAIVALVIAAYFGTLVVQIFMGGLVKAADEEMQGRDCSFGAGLSASLARFPALMGWAAIQTAVGWLLSIIRGNGGDNVVVAILRLVLASLLAVAWSIISFFVLPLIVLRHQGPIQAIKESVRLIRATWGMQIAGGVRIGGLIFLLGVLPGILVMIAGGFLAVVNAGVGIPVAVLGVIVIIAAQVFVSALRAVFSVALLHYAEAGQGVGPYAAADLAGAVRVKV